MKNVTAFFPIRALLIIVCLLANSAYGQPHQPKAPVEKTVSAVTPGVISSAADSITQTGARLNAVITPSGAQTSAYFRYGLTNGYGTTTTPIQIGAGTSNTVFHQKISMLTPNTMYHFQAAASNALKDSSGSDMVFTTLPNPPEATIQAVTGVTYNSAILSAIIQTKSAPTRVYFEWGVNLQFGNSTDTVLIPANITSTTVSAALTNLAPNTTYHVHAVAVNPGGTAMSGETDFQTLPPPPSTTTENATLIGTTQALLNASGNGQGLAANGWFEWGANQSYGNTTVSTVLAGSGGNAPFSALITGLTSGVSYHYRSVVLGAGGAAYGSDNYFTALASNREYTPDANTALLLHLDENTPDLVQDYSANNDNPTQYGTTITTGYYGNGRQFLIGNDYFQFPQDSSFDFGSTNFTIEGWVNLYLANTVDFVLVNHGNAADNSESYSLSIQHGGNVDLMLDGDGTASREFHAVTTTGAVTDNKWHHVAAVVNFTQAKTILYVDGVPQDMTVSGAFPASVFSTNASLLIGADHPLTRARTVQSMAQASIDEIRISRTARNRSDLHIGGAVAGVVFNDLNGNSSMDAGEPGLSHWLVVLGARNAFNKIGPTEVAISDTLGNYIIDGLDDGVYYVTEIQQEWWIQTYPHGIGAATVVVKNGSFSGNINFGNVIGCRYVGPPGGSWNDPSHWTCGHVPGAEDPIIVPPDTTVTMDALTVDSIKALRIRNGGRLSFNSLHHQLKVNHLVQIDSGATLSFASIADSTGFICYGDWINHGTFDPGKSIIVFSGNTQKIISCSSGSSFGGRTRRQTPGSIAAGSYGNHFYNLVIQGDSTGTDGNLIIDNQLSLDNSLTPQTTDTIFIVNDSSTAISGSGRVIGGSVRRQIRFGSSQSYRFESDESAVQFHPSAGYPGSITETVYPDTAPLAFQLYWEPVGGTVNTTDHTVLVDHVNHFTKWIVGKPGGMAKPRSLASTGGLIPGFDTSQVVHRFYAITPDANNGSFDVQVSLRYDPSELGMGAIETGLQLFRGPFVIDSIIQGWNMVSLPAEPASPIPSDVFPRSIGVPYAYSSGYIPVTTLTAGTGYWLKFTSIQTDTVMGNDYEQLDIPVAEGWNLIGALSYQTDASSVSSIDGVTFGAFYGYNHGYTPASTLRPMHGYWVKAGHAGHLRVVAPSLPQAAPRTGSRYSNEQVNEHSVATILNQLHPLLFRDALGEEQTLYFGCAAVHNPLVLELPPPPPSGIFDARYADNRLAALCPDRGVKDVPVAVTAAKYPLMLSWSKTKDAPSVSSARLLIGNKEHDLSGSGSIVVSDPDAKIVVRLSAETGSASAGLPQEYALYQNYPNPFNPVTIIGFDMPKNGAITLNIYNVLGQQVASLISNAEFAAGRYKVPFDGTNLATGVYFYKLSAAKGYVNVKKMVIIK